MSEPPKRTGRCTERLIRSKSMGKTGKKTGSLWDLLVRVRTHKALDRAVVESKDYQYTLKRQDGMYQFFRGFLPCMDIHIGFQSVVIAFILVIFKHRGNGTF